jgi:flavin reductase (DIM6/NTAB) family NADH-FMN oxidoreductase RutF
VPKPDDATFRACLGNFATGVTIITTLIDGEVHGATVSSFTSVSLDPPLVLACLAKQAKAARRLRDAAFTVNILSTAQHPHALHFSGRQQPTLDVEFEDGVVAPRLRGCVAYVSCTPWATHDAGDHDLILGEVVDIEMTAISGLDQPLLFYRGGFWHLGSSHDSLAARAELWNTSALSW